MFSPKSCGRHTLKYLRLSVRRDGRNHTQSTESTHSGALRLPGLTRVSLKTSQPDLGGGEVSQVTFDECFKLFVHVLNV